MKLRPHPLIPRDAITFFGTDGVHTNVRWLVIERTPIGYFHHRYATRAEAEAAIEPDPPKDAA